MTNQRKGLWAVISFIVSLWVLAAALPTCAPEPVEAQRAQRELTPVELDLRLAIAKMCANEFFHSDADCLLIFQTTRRHGATPEERLAWLIEHSNCVLTPTPPSQRRGNCRWTRTLTTSLDQPPGWVPERDGIWVGPNQRRWARILDMIALLLRGARPRGGWPCVLDPDTWAGRRTDREHIERLPETMVDLQCRTPERGNEGFRVMTPEQRARFEARMREYVDINPGVRVDQD